MQLLELMQSALLSRFGKANNHNDIFNLCVRLGDAPPSPPPHPLFPIECKNSAIHGKGLFATRYIKKGQLITKYRCDMVAFELPNKKTKVISTSLEQPANFSLDYAMMILSDFEDTTTYIASDPRKPFHRMTAAHLINDPYPKAHVIQNIKDIDAKKLTNAWLEYELRVQQLRNCDLHNGLYYACAIATKDIECGEEIVAPYGFEYWYNGNRHDMYSKTSEYIKSLSPRQQEYFKSILFKRLDEASARRKNLNNPT